MLAKDAAAPDFTLGDWRLLEALKQGPVLLTFFKISCPTCQLTLPFLQRLADDAAALQVVAISQDDRKGTDQFHRHFKLSLTTLLDPAPAYSASKLYEIRNVPSMFLIEPDGTISMAETGFSKPHLEQLAGRFGAEVFREGEIVPSFRPG